jgi:uncharacterized membrane protein
MEFAVVLILLAGLLFAIAPLRRLEARVDTLEAEVDALRRRASEQPLAAQPPVWTPSEAARPPVAPAAPPPRDAARYVTFRSSHADAAPAPSGEEVAAETGPIPEAEPEAADDTFATLFERLVGGRLLIWIGGIALAVAGVFLVRYSIETGLVGPRVRMGMAAIFGLLLVGAGEAARRRSDLADDPRIAQALVGAGIFVLYAATYGSLYLHALISLGTASALMALITAAALVLALRHGAPTAVMGLAGGFVTPLLVGDPDSSAVPLIAYLALLNAALFALAYRRGWTWLAASAVLLSFLWTGYLLFGEPNDALAAGVFIVAMGIAGSLVSPGTGRHLRLIFPAAIGLVQLAALVARLDLGLPAWILFGALSLGSLVLAGLRTENRPLPALALMLALVLLAGKAFGPDDAQMPTIAAGITLLFGAFGYAFAVRGHDRLLWTAIAGAATAGPALIMRLAEPQLMPIGLWGGLMAALAAGPAALVWLQRAHARAEMVDWPLLVAGSTSALLLLVAAGDWLPGGLEPAGWLVAGVAVALAARRLDDRGLSFLAVAVALLAALSAWVRLSPLWIELQASLFGSPPLVTRLPGPIDALQLLLLPAVLLMLVRYLLPASQPKLRPILLVPAAVLALGGGYIFYKQVFALGSGEDFVSRGFAERMILTQLLFGLGWFAGTDRRLFARLDAKVLAAVGTALTGLAAARFAWFDLAIHNPAFIEQRVGSLPLLNLLLPAYGAAAIWLYLARRRAAAVQQQGIWLALFLAALIVGTALLVRQLFQGSVLSGPGVPIGESYGYSLAGLLLSIGLLVAGVKLPDRALRVAGLALLTATILKVFLVDASELEGVLRILSFLGLGVALIGIGKLYGKILAPKARAAAVSAS